MRPIPNGFPERVISVYCDTVIRDARKLATRHVFTRVAKCIDVDGGIFKNVFY
jgi:hypothetical protein